MAVSKVGIGATQRACFEGVIGFRRDFAEQIRRICHFTSFIAVRGPHHVWARRFSLYPDLDISLR
jgi:hypothetical protein